jgi:hypothetical protein
MICLRARDDRRFLRDCAAMRMLAMTVVVLVLSSVLQAKVWTTVYRCDEKTLLAPVDPNHPAMYQDIMVGTKLVIVVSSDSSQSWWGSLQYAPRDGENMPLTGRGYNPVRDSFADSCFPAAGKSATARFIDDMGIWCLDLTTSAHPSPGDWFILDYCANGVGTYDLGLYDLDIAWDVPVQLLSFTQVPSCDFDRDGITNFEDFALLASHTSLPHPIVNNPSGAFDLNSDGRADFRDLADFSGHWLERTTCDTPLDPNQPAGL